MKTINIKTLILSAVILALLVLLLLSKCSTKKQANQDLISAVSQNQIENNALQIAKLEGENKALRSASDSLISVNASLNKQIYINREKASQIALKYAEEKNRVKELTNDSAAGLFLDRADCIEYPVKAYDSDYIVPVESIRFYNLLAVDCDEMKIQLLNQSLENDYLSKQVINCNRIVELKENENANLREVINEKDGINIEKDKQIIAGKRKLKAQKFKTVLVGAGGLILFGAALAL